MRRNLRIGTQLLALQLVLVLGVVGLAALLITTVERNHIRDTYRIQMTSVANRMATLPTVLDALDRPDPAATVQPLAELVREASGVTFVVVTDANGIRLSHPDPAMIGQRVSTDPAVPLAGGTYVGTQQGTLGESYRVKVPLRNRSGAVVGAVSVGILVSALDRDFARDLPGVRAWLAAAAILGAIAAVFVTRSIRRRMFGLEPSEIGQLLKTRDAVLHNIREGVVAVDEHGRLALVNDEAHRLLGLTEDPTGRPASEVFDGDGIMALVDDGVLDRDQLVLSGERVLVANRTEASVRGQQVGVVITLRDRTELFDALRELDGQRTLTETLRAQAHEFSNQLHLISGLLELGRVPDAVRFIEKVGGGGALTPANAPGEVADPALGALLLAKSSTARESGVRLSLDPESSAEVADDDVRVVVGNLVDNALEAVGPGGTVDLLVQCDDEHAVVVVEDDGPGVRPEDRLRIFEVGYSRKPGNGRVHGRGIGLALVSRIVRRRGGLIDVATSRHGGAKFQVVMEVAREVPRTELAAVTRSTDATGEHR